MHDRSMNRICLKLIPFSLALGIASGCAMFHHTHDIYDIEVKPTINNEISIKVDSRIEQYALQEVRDQSEKACHEQHRKRVIIVGQSQYYTSAAQSEYETGYHTVKAIIRCR